jgi:multidrug efflux pump subunit AcrA (membrane-fusion protein)
MNLCVQIKPTFYVLGGFSQAQQQQTENMGLALLRAQEQIFEEKAKIMSAALCPTCKVRVHVLVRGWVPTIQNARPSIFAAYYLLCACVQLKVHGHEDAARELKEQAQSNQSRIDELVHEQQQLELKLLQSEQKRAREATASKAKTDDIEKSVSLISATCSISRMVPTSEVSLPYCHLLGCLLCSRCVGCIVVVIVIDILSQVLQLELQSKQREEQLEDQLRQKDHQVHMQVAAMSWSKARHDQQVSTWKCCGVMPC